MLAYLDHSATAPLRPEATDAMLGWLTDRFGNPSGSHSVARAARAAIDDAREIVADAVGTDAGGVVFTAGGTEADNLAVFGAFARRPGVIVTTDIEHHAVLHAAEATGAPLRKIPVGADGTVDTEALSTLVDRDVTLVSVMSVNNEIGTIQPLARIAEIVRRRAPQAALHTDAVAAMPWLDVAEVAAGYDLLSISAHKFGGPQGVGALCVRGDFDLPPLTHGGGQERGRRPGTHNVAGIVGMAAAAAATVTHRAIEVPRVMALRDRLVDGILAAVPHSVETGLRAAKVAGNAHLRFAGVESEALLVLLDEAGVCASAGSACASGAMEPSHVLLALGIPAEEALGSLRLSLGPTTTDAEIDLALEAVPAAVARLRASLAELEVV